MEYVTLSFTHVRPSPLANQCKCRGLLFFISSVECKCEWLRRQPSTDCKSCKICDAFPTSLLDVPRVKPSLQRQRVSHSLHITRASCPRRRLQFLFRSPANAKHVEGGRGGGDHVRLPHASNRCNAAAAFACPCAAARRYHRMASPRSCATPWPFSSMKPKLC